MSEKRVKHRPLMTGIVKGDPIRVAGRDLIPLVRVKSQMRRRAFVGSDGVGGGGWGFVSMMPVAILDRRGDGEHRIPIHSRTERSLAWLPLVFFVVPLVSALLIVLSRRSDDKAS